MKNIVIVGAGLFGSIAAAYAAKFGIDVTVINREEPLAASHCAACLMKPGWMTGLDPADVKAGLTMLDSLYGLRTLRFKTQLPGVDTDVHWVPREQILALPRRGASSWGSQVEVLDGNVTAIEEDHVRLDDGTTFDADAVLVAAGYWSNQLVPLEMRGLAGQAHWFRGQVEKPSISVWAPYKQTVVFNETNDTVWAGDGSSILIKNWTDDRATASWLRCAKETGLELASRRLGIRPTVEGHKAGYFAALTPRLFVSTGGAKNGTILAAINAKRFVDAITKQA